MLLKSVLMCIVGGVIATLGHGVICNKRFPQAPSIAIGTLLFIVGILIAMAAEIYLLLYGTQEELIQWLFWTRR